MDAGGIVLVLHPLPGASEFNHISAGFCLPGSTASFARFPSITEGISSLPRLSVHL